MTDAIKQICEYVFENNDILRIYAEPFAHNAVSCLGLEKADFKYEEKLRSNAVKNGKVVDIGFTTGFLKLTILYANIAEEDMSKLGFLSDGRTPLLVSCKGQTVSHVFPEKTIVLDRFLKAEKERNRRFFTIAHEAFHYLNSLVNNVPQQAAFHNEFDLDCHYTREDFARMMSVQECQADRGAAALLMPKSLLLQTCMQFNDGKPIAVYGNSVFTAADRAVLFEIAEYLRVSFTALVIRMEHLKLFEKHDFSEYVSSELHLGNPEAYG